MPFDSATLELLELNKPIPSRVNDRENGVNNQPEWENGYAPCRESVMTDNMIEGPVKKFSEWQESTVFPGTKRQVWVYHTPNLDSTETPKVMFFNDGAWYLSRKGPVQATNVLNHLFHTGEIPATIAIFVTPGVPDHHVPGPIESYDDTLAQRSLEYDVLSARYGDFLFSDLLPLAENHIGVTASTDPKDRIVCGISSGGIAAFSVAWFHSDKCQRVISHCGSFTDIWGGHNYPSVLRRTPRKPIRVFLQSGENDANTPFGDWAVANKAMASALEYAGYDYRFEFGVGGHSLNHGGALFADSLRWITRN